MSSENAAVKHPLAALGDFSKFKVPELKEFLKQYDLPVSGKKAELVARLESLVDSYTGVGSSGEGQNTSSSAHETSNESVENSAANEETAENAAPEEENENQQEVQVPEVKPEDPEEAAVEETGTHAEQPIERDEPENVEEQLADAMYDENNPDNQQEQQE